MSFHQLDNSAYQELLGLLNNQHFTDLSGKEVDISFLYKDWWLQDTAVIERIEKRCGLWEIHLIFAHYQKPHQLLKRRITSTYCRKKAALQASYMRRLAAKDQRGTLTINAEQFIICDN